MKGYVIDASVAIKWFIPEIHSDAAFRVRLTGQPLHMPAFMVLELGNVIAKKIRKRELTREIGEAILKEMKYLPLRRHPDGRLFPSAYELALSTQQSLYDCLYLAAAEAADAQMITADRKFYAALSEGPYKHRVVWVEDL